jgi:hypothetical protein
MSQFVEALVSESRSERIPAGRDLFGQFVGEWDFEWIDRRGTDRERHVRGEWLFSWIMEGTAVQDLFICPSRAERIAHPQPDAEYGTTVRIYNSETGAWDVFYGCHNQATRLEARKKGDRIELTEIEGKAMKWVFSDIGTDSFHWENTVTQDGGATWKTVGELYAARRK